MPFEHRWQNREANFAAPISEEVRGGAHVSFEILLTFQGSFLALRRPKGVPGHALPEKARQSPAGLLYLCYDLIRWGESTGECIARIVREQCAAEVCSYKAAQFYSFVHAESNNWALTPCFTAELASIPGLSPEVTEVFVFTRENIPNEIAWWTAEQLRELMD